MRCDGAEPDAPPRRGSVWLLSGIESASWMLGGVRRGLRDGGVTAAIREYRWQIPVFNLLNLFLFRRNRRVAGELADILAREKRAAPLAPVDLVGYSGGSAIALWAAEALDESIRLRNVVLVQSALSPRYDLSPALRRIDGKLVHFWSPIDLAILGVGTTVFGTMDRRHRPAAGLRGFDLGGIGDEALRRRVEQHRWSPRMWRRGGHFGEHFSMLRYRWNREYVAPCLVSTS